ncbi:MAG: FkbM family methyltransferase [Adhaeribacter sp.]
MIYNLTLLYRFVRLFGLHYGLRLFLQYAFNKTDNILLPGIQKSIRLRKGTSDFKTFIQVFIDKHYEIDFVGQPKVIIDGGANIGLFSVLIKNNFPETKIIAIEPDIENFETLQHNMSGYEQVYCENFGLWNKESNLKIYDKYQMGKWGMVVEEVEGESNIKAVSIDFLLRKYNIEKVDILKLDIETSEKVVFSDNYESWLPKVKMIIVELHDDIEDFCAQPFFAAIQKCFKKYSYLIKGENTIVINRDIE